MPKRVETADFKLEDLIQILKLVNEQLPDGKRDPVCTYEEIMLINAIIYNKRGNAILRALVEYLGRQETPALLFTAPQVRKLRFLDYYMNVDCKAAAAARHAGYSSKTAKQQGYRVFKELQVIFKGKQK